MRDAGDEVGFLFVELQLPEECAPRRQQANQRRERRTQNQRAEKFCATALGGKHLRPVGQKKLQPEARAVRHHVAAELLRRRS